MLRTVVPLAATSWMALSAIVTLAERTPHPALWVPPAILIATGWVLGWLRSDALEATVDEGLWSLLAIGLIPVLGLSAIPMFYGEPRETSLALLKTFLFLVPLVGLMLSAKIWAGRGETLVPVPVVASPATPSSHPNTPKNLTRPGTLMVAVGDSRRFLQTHEILWLEADGNYVRVHTADRDYFVRQSLREALDRLGSADFARIHKSCAVNRAEIGAVRSNAKGDAVVGLRNGHQLKMSRRFRHELRLSEAL